MNSEILFSIIIPTYNRADFICETVSSVLNQSLENFEVIVIDDGSTDNTRQIVAEIEDERVSYYYKPNEERAAARNAGAERAAGKYLTFLDSDDLFYKNHLETALEVIEKHNQPEWFHLGYEIKGKNGDIFSKFDSLPEIANKILIEGNHLSCRGVFLRHDVALKHRFNAVRKLSGTEDYELWLRLASRYPLYCDNRITSAIIQHDSRSVINTDREKLIERIDIFENSLMKDEKFVEKFSDRLAEFQANNRVYIALHLALTKKNRAGTIKYLLKSLSFSRKALNQRAFYGAVKRLFV